MKFNDEQLSRILSGHAGGKTVLCGPGVPPERRRYMVYQDRSCGCLLELAFAMSFLELLDSSDNESASIFYEDNYKIDWTPEQFLEAIASQGLS